jgi:hypothetical protein
MFSTCAQLRRVMFAGVQGLFTEEVIRCFAYVFIELYREGWLGAVCGRRSHRQPVTADTDRIGDLSKSRCAQHVPTVAATQEYGSLGVADASRETSRVITRYRGFLHKTWLISCCHYPREFAAHWKLAQGLVQGLRSLGFGVRTRALWWPGVPGCVCTLRQG